MKNALKLGLIIGVISIFISLIMEFIFSIDYLFSYKSIGISFLISFLLMVVLGRMILRTEDYPNLSYGEALKFLFVASIVSGIIGQVVMIARHQNNDEMKIAFNDYAIESQISGLKMGMGLAGVDESEIEDKVEELKISIENGETDTPDYPFTFSKLPINLLNGAFMGLIFSLIAAIFVKEKASGT